MGKIIMIANTKGGCGKSTVTVNLAVDLASRHNVGVLDADIQRSTSIFNHNRKKADREPLNIIHADGEAMKKVIAANDKILIIDTGAFDTPEYRSVMTKADMIIAPTSDSSYDLYGLLLFSQKFDEYRKINKKFRVFVLANKIELKTKGYAEIAAFVADNKKIFTLLDSKLSERKEFKTAFDEGLGVSEIRGTMAGREIRALGREIEKCLKVK